jgi:hypothetical protein
MRGLYTTRSREHAAPADPGHGRLAVAGFVYFTFEAMPDPR